MENKAKELDHLNHFLRTEKTNLIIQRGNGEIDKSDATEMIRVLDIKRDHVIAMQEGILSGEIDWREVIPREDPVLKSLYLPDTPDNEVIMNYPGWAQRVYGFNTRRNLLPALLAAPNKPLPMIQGSHQQGPRPNIVGVEEEEFVEESPFEIIRERPVFEDDELVDLIGGEGAGLEDLYSGDEDYEEEGPSHDVDVDDFINDIPETEPLPYNDPYFEQGKNYRPFHYLDNTDPFLKQKAITPQFNQYHYLEKPYGNSIQHFEKSLESTLYHDEKSITNDPFSPLSPAMADVTGGSVYLDDQSIVLGYPIHSNQLTHQINDFRYKPEPAKYDPVIPVYGHLQDEDFLNGNTGEGAWDNDDFNVPENGGGSFFDRVTSTIGELPTETTDNIATGALIAGTTVAGLGAAYTAYKHLGGKEKVKSAYRWLKRRLRKQTHENQGENAISAAGTLAAIAYNPSEAGVAIGNAAAQVFGYQGGDERDFAPALAQGEATAAAASSGHSQGPRPGPTAPGASRDGDGHGCVGENDMEIVPVKGLKEDVEMGTAGSLQGGSGEDGMKLIASYDSRKGKMSSLWESKKNKDGKMSKRSKYMKHRAKDNSWKRVTRSKRIQYMARGRKGYKPRMKKHWGKTMKEVKPKWSSKTSLANQVAAHKKNYARNVRLANQGQAVLKTLKK